MRISDWSSDVCSSDLRSIEAIPVLTSMSLLVAELVHDALDSFAARDAELAVRVTVRDKNVDDFYKSIFRTLVTFMMENPKKIGRASSRERVCQYVSISVVDVTVKNKNNTKKYK